MPFHHEKLIVYRRALEFTAWSQVLVDSLTKKTSTRDHLERAGDSIALNIAEGNGKFSLKDRARLGLGIGGLSQSFRGTTLLRAGRHRERETDSRRDCEDAVRDA